MPYSLDSHVLRHRYPTDIAGVLVLRMIGCRVRPGDTNVSYSSRVRITWLALAVGLLVWHASYIVDATDAWEFLRRSWIWSLIYIVAAYAVFRVAHALTQGFLGITVPLWEALSGRGRQSYGDWYAAWGRGPVQLACGLVAGAATGGALRAVDVATRREEGLLQVVPASYAVVMIVGFVVGAAAYWAAAGIVLCRTLTRPGHLKLYPLAPAQTPGVEELSRLMLNTSSAGILLIGLLLTPVLITTAGLEGSSVGGVRTAFVAVCATLLIGVSIQPQIRLSRAVRDRRRATMRALLHQYYSVADQSRRGLSLTTARIRRARGNRERQRIADQIAQVAGSPASTLGSANTVQILASGAAIFIPLVVSGISLAVS
jgi:hypothetical protein